jgi:hypothetical protein
LRARLCNRLMVYKGGPRLAVYQSNRIAPSMKISTVCKIFSYNPFWVIGKIFTMELLEAPGRWNNFYVLKKSLQVCHYILVKLKKCFEISIWVFEALHFRELATLIYTFWKIDKLATLINTFWKMFSKNLFTFQIYPAKKLIVHFSILNYLIFIIVSWNCQQANASRRF